MSLTRAFVILLVAISVGCGDPARRVIVANYCLENWSERHYNINGCTVSAKLHGKTDAGPLEGHVVKLGWDDRFIIAQRAHLIGGTLAWMVLDTNEETLRGPYDDAAVEKIRHENPRLGAIKILDVGEAWPLLR